jgi:hypothetical protein
VEPQANGTAAPAAVIPPLGDVAAPAPAPATARIEQADHVQLIEAQGHERTTAALAQAAEQAVLAARSSLALAELRLAAARQTAAAARDACANLAKGLREKYAVVLADEVTPDGTIWRAEG